MADIQSATAEIRPGKKRKKKEERRKKPQGKNIMSASATQSGHKKSYFFLSFPMHLHSGLTILEGFLLIENHYPAQIFTHGMQIVAFAHQ